MAYEAIMDETQQKQMPLEPSHTAHFAPPPPQNHVRKSVKEGIVLGCK